MSIPDRITLYPKNDQVIEVFGLHNQVISATSWLNAATVTATLKDSAGAAVTGLSALALAYIAASNGDYRGQVEDTFNPAPGDDYTLHIDASEAGIVLHIEIPVSVQVRAQ